MGGLICCSEKFLKRDLKFEEEDYVNINENQSFIKQVNNKSPKKLLENKNENKKINQISKSRNVIIKKKAENCYEKKSTIDFNVENGNFDTFARFPPSDKTNTNGDEVKTK
jgi:hypothetical protein